MAIPIPQELTERIIFKTVTGARNAVSGLGTSDTTAATAWARVTDQGGIVEATDQENLAQTRNYEIWTQYNSNITGFMQITWGDKTLAIVGAPQKIIDVNNRHWTVIQATEVTEDDLSD